jgi:hypothetical protein
MYTKFKRCASKIMYIDSPLLLLISIALAIGIWAWVKINIGVE